MKRAVSDFETASACDLKLAGAWAYAEHCTTEILVLVVRVKPTGQLIVWHPGEDKAELLALVNDPDVLFVSHASFEQAIWQRQMVEIYDFPPLPPERWHDTQAVCAWKNMPLKLEQVLQKLGLKTEKDMEGRRLTLSLSKPMTKKAWTEQYPGQGWGTKKAWDKLFPKGQYDRRPSTLARVDAYCVTDVEGEAELDDTLGELSGAERKVWLLDQQINQRGLKLDMEFVRAAQQVVDKASARLSEEFADLTGGLRGTQREKVMAWCAGQGVELENLQKGYLAELLGDDEDTEIASNAGDDVDVPTGQEHAALPERVQRVLRVRQMLGSASIKKLAAMRACVNSDGRARGLCQYHAAGPGRWGGRIIQPHNFPRGSLKMEYGYDAKGRPIIKAPKPQVSVDAIMTGDYEYVEAILGAPAIECVSSSLRHAIVAEPGKELVAGDFAGIEARIVLALAGQHDKTALMASGADVYLDMASDIYNVPKGTLNKDQHVAERTIGKNTVLGCGFQMGALKFQARYCPHQPVEFAYGVIGSYREKWAPLVPELWRAFNDAVWRLIRWHQPSTVFGCTFHMVGRWMAIDLPSGWQRLWYFNPGMREKLNRPGSFGPSYFTMKSGQWKQVDLFGGIVTENIVQALARGLLVSAMFRLEQAGYPIVLTVHDEIVCELDSSLISMPVFEPAMAEPTPWSDKMQVPVAVEAWQGLRYRK